ncbi:MAG TPA: CopD family protein [Gemmatimonadaceae bacterium]|nr:CopD family protein [Gemmatimonadaceae bacterium]
MDVGSPLYILIRWLGYLGVAAAVGAVAFRLLIVPRVEHVLPAGSAEAERALDGARRVMFGGAVLLVLAHGAKLFAQRAVVETLGPVPLATIVFRTLWGRAWLLGAVGAATLLAAAAARGARRRWLVAAAALATVALSLALSGHAGGAPEHAPVLVLADALHVLAMGCWLGTLFVLVAAATPLVMGSASAERVPTVAALINAFSPFALASGSVILLTGVLAAWAHLPSFGSLLTSDYGRVLLLKLGVLAVLAFVGAFNWLVMRPRLADDASVAAIRRSALVELVLAAIVLGVAAVLVGTSPPEMMSSSAGLTLVLGG